MGRIIKITKSASGKIWEQTESELSFDTPIEVYLEAVFKFKNM